LGKVIGPHDTPISAIAFQYEWTLVTNPTDAFSRVEDGTVGCRQK
jgi:predicted nucleic acid-binding protein